MKHAAMKLKIPLFSGLLFILTSCSGQGAGQNGSPDKFTEPPPGDTVKELSSNIMVVYQDKKNNYWFGSWRDGLYRYNGHAITRFTTKDGLPDNRIEEIKEDRAGNIFINTAKGICFFNGKQFITLTETISAGNYWKLSPGDLWFKCPAYSGFVYRYDGTNLFRLKLPPTGIGEAYMQKHPAASKPYAVYCVYNDSKGNIWFGTAVLGVCRYNGKSFDWITEADVTELHNGPANGVRSIAEDRNGDFWFNTEYRYSIYSNHASTESNPGNQAFYTRQKSTGSLDGKKNGSLNEYLSITKDNNDDLWIATYRDGVWKYDGTAVTHYPVQQNAETINLFYIYNDRNGNLWLGTHENGAFKFNGRIFERFKP